MTTSGHIHDDAQDHCPQLGRQPRDVLDVRGLQGGTSVPCSAAGDLNHEGWISAKNWIQFNNRNKSLYLSNGGSVIIDTCVYLFCRTEKSNVLWGRELGAMVPGKGGFITQSFITRPIPSHPVSHVWRLGGEDPGFCEAIGPGRESKDGIGS